MPPAAKTTTAAKPGTARAAKAAGKGSGLSRKIGPLPLWAWAAVAGLALYVGYRWYKSSQASQQAAVAPSDQSTGTDASDNGLAGSGVPVPSGDSGSSGSSGDTFAESAFASQEALLGQAFTNEQQLVSNLGLGAQTLAMDEFNQLAALVASGLKVSGGSSAGGGGGGGGSSSGTPAKTAAPDNEPNPGLYPVVKMPSYQVPAAPGSPGPAYVTVPGGITSPTTGLSGHGPQLTG